MGGLLGAAMVLCSQLPVQAQDLVAAWDLARAHDARLQSAQASELAAQARGAQTHAPLWPQIGLAAGSTRSRLDSTLDFPGGQQKPVSHYSQHTVGLQASQALYRPAAVVSARQGDKQAEVATHERERAAQQLIARVTQAYFEVLSAQDDLSFTQQLEQAVAEQKALADRQFELGNATITDSREAQARADQVQAQRIAAETRLQVARLTLDTLLGITGFQPYPLAQPLHLPDVSQPGLDEWVNTALDQHPLLAQARLAVQLAELETQKARAGHRPTVDLVASAGRVNYPDGNPQSNYPGVPTRANQVSIGVQLTMPLFAGFAVQNRVRETLALEDKAHADLRDAQQQITLGVRSAWLNLQAARARIRALEAAQASAQTALDANRLGYDVGVRINLDVLNAQTQLYEVRRQLAQASHDLLVGWLRLHEAAGVLRAEALSPINGLLAHVSAPAR